MDLKIIQETAEMLLKKDKCLYPAVFIETFKEGNYILDVRDAFDNTKNIQNFVQTFSKTLEEKTRELKLFEEVHNFSLIKNKLLVKVDKETYEHNKE